MSKALARTDQPYFIISIGKTEKSKLSYYQDEIERLNKVIEDYKSIINDTMDKRDYIKALEGFRNMFVLDCISHNVRKTILQCSESIRQNKCTFHDRCKPRKELMNKIVCSA